MKPTYIFYKILFFSLFLINLKQNSFAQISGKVFRDFNANGTKDNTATYNEVFEGSIVINAYSSTGTLLATQTTSSTGTTSNYTFPASGANSIASGVAVRLEFILPSYYFSSNGNASNSTVQFKTAGAAITADLGINYPDEYSTNTNPYLITSQYINGTYNNATSSVNTGVFSFQYGSTGNANGISNPANTKATIGQMGATWGVAYKRSSKTMFTSAVYRRYCGLGSLGTGGIYKVDMTNPTSNSGASSYIDVTTIGIPTGADVRTASGCNSISAGIAIPSNDIAASNNIGKLGIGGIDYDEKRNTIWLVNMTDKKLYGIGNINDSVAPVLADKIGGFDITLPTGYTVTSGVLRPWGVKSYQGFVYVGAVADGSLSADIYNLTNLKGYILKFDPNNTAAGFSVVKEFNFNNLMAGYGANSGQQQWLCWETAGVNTTFWHNQPIVGDIEFDSDGSLIVGIIDRSGLQHGNENYEEPVCNTTITSLAAKGDVLRFCKTATGYDVSGSGTCTTTIPAAVLVDSDGNPAAPNTYIQEYYWGEHGPVSGTNANFNETALGALAFLPGSNQVMTTSMDPENYHSGGVITLNNTTGGDANRYNIYRTSVTIGTTGATMAKAIGLGDIELIGDIQPIEIGNLVFFDADSDGIQDANETGINGIILDLYQGATKVGTTTTATLNGQVGSYFFTNANVNLGGATGLLPNTAYEIRLPNASGGSKQAGLGIKILTLLNQGANDLIDNDASTSGTNAIIALTTGSYGENNHSYDFGFKCIIPTISGATLTAGTCSDVTPNDDAQIVIATNGNKANKVIGATYSAGPTSTAVSSLTVTTGNATFTNLKHATQYTFRVWNTDGECYRDTTLTTPTKICSVCAGAAGDVAGKAFKDFNNNGVKDATETTVGLAGITVKAYDCTGVLLGTQTTDQYGNYKFTGMPTAKIRLEFSNLPAPYKPSASGTDNGSSTQFVTAPDCNADFGVNNPGDYCGTNITLTTSLFYGVHATDLNKGTLISFPNAAGTLSLPTGATPSPTTIAKVNQVGATFGLAYHRASKTLLSASYYKYRTAFGTGGQDAIYATDAGADGTMGTADDVISTFLEFDAIYGANSTGSNIYATPNTALGDPTMVGKASFGDIDMSADGTKLYVMNIGDRKIYTIPVAGKPLVANTAAIQISPVIPNDAVNCAGGTLRPFAIEQLPSGKLLVGAVCEQYSARIYVWGYDPNTNTWDAAPSMSGAMELCCWGNWANMDYNRGAIIAGLELADNGDLIIGIREREADSEAVRNQGDILKAGANGSGGWTLENNAVAGNYVGAQPGTGLGQGGGQYFNDTSVDGTNVSIMGGLSVIQGSGQVMATFDDAFRVYTASATWFNQKTGLQDKKYEIGELPYIYPETLDGKQSVLGEIEPLCNIQPIEIGNYVWEDTNGDGVQAPCEDPLVGVKVTLYKQNGTKIAEMLTSASGNYYFNETNVDTLDFAGTPAAGFTGLSTNTSYYIVLGEGGQFTAGKLNIAGKSLELTTKDATTNNGNDQNDSDGLLLSGAFAAINGYPGFLAKTPSSGSDHTFDFGFTSCSRITTPSPTQTLCVGATGSNITVNTTQIATNGIKFMRFTSAQTGVAMYTGGTLLATVTPSGGVATYTWNSTDFPNTGTTQIIYYVYAILNPDPGVGCQPSQEIQIRVNPTPGFSLAQTNVTCFGSGNGTITTTTTSGTTPFTYSIDDGATFPNTTGVFNSLVPATYKIAVKDNNGCVKKCN